jgi:hypothetical protein
MEHNRPPSDPTPGKPVLSRISRLFLMIAGAAFGLLILKLLGVSPAKP